MEAAIRRIAARAKSLAAIDLHNLAVAEIRGFILRKMPGE